MCIQSWDGFPSSLMCFHLFERIGASTRLLPKNWEKFHLHPVCLHPQIQFILHGRLLQSINLIIFFGYLQVFKAKKNFFNKLFSTKSSILALLGGFRYPGYNSKMLIIILYYYCYFYYYHSYYFHLSLLNCQLCGVPACSVLLL